MERKKHCLDNMYFIHVPYELIWEDQIKTRGKESSFFLNYDISKDSFLLFHTKTKKKKKNEDSFC